MKKEKLIPNLYLGEQVDFLGNIFQVFRDKDGKISKFTGVKWIFVGNVYGISERGTIKTKPEKIEDSGLAMTDKEIKASEANKLIVKHRRLEKRKALEVKKPHPDIVRAVNLLKPFMRSMDLLNQKRFMEYIANETSRKTKR